MPLSIIEDGDNTAAIVGKHMILISTIECYREETQRDAGAEAAARSLAARGGEGPLYLTAATTFAAAVASVPPKMLMLTRGLWSFRLPKTNRKRRRRRGHHGQAYEPHSRRHEVRRGYRATRRETAKMSSPTRYEPWTASVGLLQCFYTAVRLGPGGSSKFRRVPGGSGGSWGTPVPTSAPPSPVGTQGTPLDPL